MEDEALARAAAAVRARFGAIAERGRVITRERIRSKTLSKHIPSTISPIDAITRRERRRRVPRRAPCDGGTALSEGAALRHSVCGVGRAAGR